MFVSFKKSCVFVIFYIDLLIVKEYNYNILFVLVKCNDGNCLLNVYCVNNKCMCMFGFVNVFGVCEGRI